MTERHHGGDLSLIRERYPDAPRPWIDLSTGINPHAWPWRDRLTAAELDAAAVRLPARADLDACRAAYANYLSPDLSPEDLILAPGSQFLIETLPALFPAGEVVIPGPTYTEHARCWRRAGHRVTEIPYDAALFGSLPPGGILLLTHPNNPDGRHFDPAVLHQWIERYSHRGGRVILDEAFADTDPALSLLRRPLPDGTVVLRSAGKFSGLAGLRLGAAVCRGPIAERLRARQELWNVSTLTLAIFTRLFRDRPWIEETRHRLATDMRRLRDLLRANDLAPGGGTSLFCLVTGRDMARRADALAGAGLYVRRFPGRDDRLRFGLPPDASAWRRLQHQLEKTTHDHRQ